MPCALPSKKRAGHPWDKPGHDGGEDRIPTFVSNASLTSCDQDLVARGFCLHFSRYPARKGSMSVWQYAVHKSSSGDLEQAPLHKIGLLATDSLRVEPYASPLKVLPIDESKK